MFHLEAEESQKIHQNESGSKTTASFALEDSGSATNTTTEEDKSPAQPQEHHIEQYRRRLPTVNSESEPADGSIPLTLPQPPQETMSWRHNLRPQFPGPARVPPVLHDGSLPHQLNMGAAQSRFRMPPSYSSSRPGGYQNTLPGYSTTPNQRPFHPHSRLHRPPPRQAWTSGPDSRSRAQRPAYSQHQEFYPPQPPIAPARQNPCRSLRPAYNCPRAPETHPGASSWDNNTSATKYTSGISSQSTTETRVNEEERNVRAPAMEGHAKDRGEPLVIRQYTAGGTAPKFVPRQISKAAPKKSLPKALLQETKTFREKIKDAVNDELKRNAFILDIEQGPKLAAEDERKRDAFKISDTADKSLDRTMVDIREKVKEVSLMYMIIISELHVGNV